MKLRVAILAHALRVAGGASVGRNVIAALPRIGDQHEYLLIMPADAGYEGLTPPPHSERRYYRRRRGMLGQWWFENISVPKLVRDFRPDVIWGLGNSGLRRPCAAQAVLLQNAHYAYPPDPRYGDTTRAALVHRLGRRRIRRCLPATQLVFCQTETMARRFRQAYGFKGRTALMPNAVSRMVTAARAAPPPPIFERCQGRFTLLCLTKYYGHKNLGILLALFEQHASQLSDVAVLFTVAGDQHPMARDFLKRIARVAPDNLLNVGPIPQTELAGYYQHSDALILPTLLESFSGTYLEAMHFRRPILTSDLDFARDVCGPAAEYFDPLDPKSIHDAILRLKTSAARRDELVAAGDQRFATHVRSWDEIVADAIGELERLVNKTD